MKPAQEDMIIKMMKTLIKYLGDNKNNSSQNYYRCNGQLHPKIKKQLYKIVEKIKYQE